MSQRVSSLRRAQCPPRLRAPHHRAPLVRLALRRLAQHRLAQHRRAQAHHQVLSLQCPPDPQGLVRRLQVPRAPLALQEASPLHRQVETEALQALPLDPLTQDAKAAQQLSPLEVLVQVQVVRRESLAVCLGLMVRRPEVTAVHLVRLGVVRLGIIV